MLKTGLLNPHLLSLLARVRHTNALVIADRGFPFWPGIETVDISLVDGVPTVLQVLAAVRQNFVVAEAFMAEEFLKANTPATRQAFARGLCVVSPDLIACGSSPSTISLHDLRPGGRSRQATLTFDVRNAIHGLAVWPFGWSPKGEGRPLAGAD